MKLIITTLLFLFVFNAQAKKEQNKLIATERETLQDSSILNAMGGKAIEHYNKGYYYLTGTGDVDKNDTEAKKWFNLAAESSSPAVRYKIGRMFETGSLYQQSYTEAFRHYSFSADKGDIYAINNLAILYINGKGVTKSTIKGIELFTEAANRGNTEAQINLGLYYLKAKQESSITSALKWFTEAAKDNNPVALYYLAEYAFAEKDYVKAYDYYLDAARQSNPDAQLKLAMLYAKGIGIKEDKNTSIEWLNKSAELGNKQAIAILGSMIK